MNRYATKRQRIRLWLAANGHCQRCDNPIDHTFHADHKTPWRLTRDTNIHAMQALCPKCNLQKGSK